MIGISDARTSPSPPPLSPPIAKLRIGSWEVHGPFLTENYFHLWEQLHIYFNDMCSVSFKLTSSILFCPLCILKNAWMEFFPTVLSGIFHPGSLMKFIFFSSIEQGSRHVEMSPFLAVP